MAEATQAFRKFGVDPPVPPYPGFKDKEDVELHGLPTSQYATDQHPSFLHDGYHTYNAAQLPIILEEERQKDHASQKEEPIGLTGTGFYLNRRNSRILAIIFAFLSAGLISGWVTAIVFAKKLSHVSAVQNITITLTSTTVQPTTLVSMVSTTSASTVTQTSTTIQSLSLSFTSTTVLSTTLTSIQSASTTTRLSTLSASIVTSVSTVPASNATVTQTSTVMATPTTLSNSTVYTCHQLLGQICRGIDSVPLAVSGGGSGLFGDCEPVFRYFYCEYLFDLSNTPAAVGAQPQEVNGSWPAVEAMECVGMRPYCINYGESTEFQGKPSD